MKKILSLSGFLLAIVAVTFATTFPEQIPYIGEFIIGSHGAALAVIAPWFVMTGTDKAFKALTGEEYEALDDEQKSQYEIALLKHNTEKEAAIKAELTKLQVDATANKDIIKQLKDQLDAMNKDIPAMLIALKAQGTELAKLKNTGAISKDTFKKRMKAAFDEKASDIIDLEKRQAQAIFSVAKASQMYGDITDGSDFAYMRPGVIDKPVRRTRIRQLFSTIPLSTEYYKYTEQTTVVRDAKGVALCTAVTSNTKETLTVQSKQTVVIKDMITFCRDFIADYPFMQSRIDKLIRDSMALEIDKQLLGVSTSVIKTDSILGVASEFSAANVSAPVTASIQAANFIDLIGAMDMQIDVLSEGEFMPDTVIVNRHDWFRLVESLKDKNDNYLSKDIVTTGGSIFIKGMLVVMTSICPSGACIVFDSTKGEILDRMTIEVEISTTDGTDWQAGLAKIMAKERLNFIVPSNYANAFMKCTDIDVAIAAITKP